MFLYNSFDYAQDLCTALASVPQLERLRGSSVLITGATGLIGSFIVDMLLHYNAQENAGIDVYALGRSAQRLAERFEGAPAGEHLHFLEHDVHQPPAFDVHADYLIHAASNSYPASFAEDPVGTILSNVLGTHYLLRYAKEHSCRRFLFVSSGEVYGRGDPDLAAFCEPYSGYVDPTNPRSCYPASKRAAETLCVSYTQQYELDTVIARPCHTYGPNTTKSDNRASAQFVNNALAGQDIVMKSSGEQMRSYCYVADCASAMLTVLLHGKSCEAYNIANKDARISIMGFARTVAELAGRKVIYQEPDRRERAQQTNIPAAVLDSEKLSALGWSGKYTVEQGVASTLKTLDTIVK